MIITVVDVETTGLDPAVDRVVEIARINVVERGATDRYPWLAVDPWSTFVNPGRAIPPEASAVHHIVDDDVVDAPSLEDAVSFGFKDIDIIAAHNARFERSFLSMFHEKRWLDTYRCAMHVWPDAPNFKNQTLRYWLGLDLPHGRTLAHVASGDALVTARVLVRLLAERPLDELLRLSTKACVLKKVGFGKYFRQLWSEVPSSYLTWARGAADLDPDVRFTVHHELARRRGDGRAAQAVETGLPLPPSQDGPGAAADRGVHGS